MNEKLPKQQDFRLKQFLLERKIQDGSEKNPHQYIYDNRPNFTCFENFQNFQVMRTYMPSSNQFIKLYYTKLTPKVKEATMCIIHGYGSNSDQYLKVAEFFANRNFVVNMIDLRGFGYSGGSRVNSSIRDTIQDIQYLLRYCCERGLPTYILAHGLGATLILALMQENSNLPLAGVIALSPLLNFPNINRSSLLHKIVINLSPTIFDDLLINNLINPTGLTKDPKTLQQLIIGVFNFQYVTLKMAHTYDQLTYKVKKDGFKFVYPILILYGGQDTVQSFSQIKKLYNEISSVDKQIKTFPNGLHELHQDLQAQQVFQYIFNWINKSRGAQLRKKIKWTTTQKLNLDTLTPVYYFKKMILVLAIVLLILYKFFRRRHLK